MNVSCEMLLHPELLSSEQLLYIIKERRLNIANLENMPRHELLDIFHNYCVPYGQRKYRDSGRGKMLNKARPANPEIVAKLDVIHSNQHRKLTHLEAKDRATPPPDLLTGHMKRIKLDIKSQPASDVNVWKRKMSIDSTAQAPNSPPPKKERKLITWP